MSVQQLKGLVQALYLHVPIKEPDAVVFPSSADESIRRGGQGKDASRMGVGDGLLHRVGRRRQAPQKDVTIGISCDGAAIRVEADGDDRLQESDEGRETWGGVRVGVQKNG